MNALSTLRLLVLVIPALLYSCNLPKAPTPVFTDAIHALLASCKNDLQAEELTYEVKTSLTGDKPETTILCKVINCKKLPDTIDERSATASTIAYYFYHALQNKQEYDKVTIVFATEKNILIKLRSYTTFTYTASALEAAAHTQDSTQPSTSATATEETETPGEEAATLLENNAPRGGTTATTQGK